MKQLSKYFIIIYYCIFLLLINNGSWSKSSIDLSFHKKSLALTCTSCYDTNKIITRNEEDQSGNVQFHIKLRVKQDKLAADPKKMGTPLMINGNQNLLSYRNILSKLIKLMDPSNNLQQSDLTLIQLNEILEKNIQLTHQTMINLKKELTDTQHLLVILLLQAANEQPLILSKPKKNSKNSTLEILKRWSPTHIAWMSFTLLLLIIAILSKTLKTPKQIKFPIASNSTLSTLSDKLHNYSPQDKSMVSRDSPLLTNSRCVLKPEEYIGGKLVTPTKSPPRKKDIHMNHSSRSLFHSSPSSDVSKFNTKFGWLMDGGYKKVDTTELGRHSNIHKQKTEPGHDEEDEDFDYVDVRTIKSLDIVDLFDGVNCMKKLPVVLKRETVIPNHTTTRYSNTFYFTDIYDMNDEITMDSSLDVIDFSSVYPTEVETVGPMNGTISPPPKANHHPHPKKMNPHKKKTKATSKYEINPINSTKRSIQTTSMHPNTMKLLSSHTSSGGKMILSPHSCIQPNIKRANLFDDFTKCKEDSTAFASQSRDGMVLSLDDIYPEDKYGIHEGGGIEADEVKMTSEDEDYESFDQYLNHEPSLLEPLQHSHEEEKIIHHTLRTFFLSPQLSSVNQRRGKVIPSLEKSTSEASHGRSTTSESFSSSVSIGYPSSRPLYSHSSELDPNGFDMSNPLDTSLRNSNNQLKRLKKAASLYSYQQFLCDRIDQLHQPPPLTTSHRNRPHAQSFHTPVRGTHRDDFRYVKTVKVDPSQALSV